uniref:Uncharacterized protein n=1 Tax=Moniliophthora roreri TaxID=221103 RepID=A0A0W0FDZ3_MONRR
MNAFKNNFSDQDLVKYWYQCSTKKLPKE